MPVQILYLPTGNEGGFKCVFSDDSHICNREIVKTLLLHHLITAVSQSSVFIILHSEFQNAIWHICFKCYICSAYEQYNVNEPTTELFSCTDRSSGNKK